MKIVIVSGGFDPLHSGHISYFDAASKLGDKLIIALNSDVWLKRKKGIHFMPFQERKTILESLSVVDSVISFEDDDVGSCCDALIKIKRNILLTRLSLQMEEIEIKIIFQKCRYQGYTSNFQWEDLINKIHLHGF